MSLVKVLAVLIPFFLGACLPDEPRFTIIYRGPLVGGLAPFNSCLPRSARNIIVNHDRLRGTRRGTFAFTPGDESLQPLLSRYEVPAARFAARNQTSDWWPSTPLGDGPSKLRVYRCEEMPFLVAVNEATGEGYFRERR